MAGYGWAHVGSSTKRTSWLLISGERHVRQGQCRSLRTRTRGGQGHPPVGGSGPERPIAPSTGASSRPAAGQPTSSSTEVTGSRASSISSRSRPLADSSRRSALRDRRPPTLPGLDPVTGELGIIDQPELNEPIQHLLGDLGGHPLGLERLVSSWRVRALAASFGSTICRATSRGSASGSDSGAALCPRTPPQNSTSPVTGSIPAGTSSCGPIPSRSLIFFSSSLARSGLARKYGSCILSTLPS